MLPHEHKSLLVFLTKTLGIAFILLSLFSVILMDNYWISLLLIALANYYLFYPKFWMHAHTLLTCALILILNTYSSASPVVLLLSITIALVLFYLNNLLSHFFRK